MSDGSSVALASRMPCISRFFGIAVFIWFRDHEPPHFHAVYGEFEAALRIDTLEVIGGSLPRRTHALVLEWAALHRGELADDWERARRGDPLVPIQPLDP